MVMVMDIFKQFINTKKKQIAMRAIISSIFFLLGLSMTSRVKFISKLLLFLIIFTCFFQRVAFISSV
jgi:hypothetical protein